MQKLTNDLEVLAGLRERGDLTDEEFARAKAALLGATWYSAPALPQTSLSAQQLEKIARQNEIAQLDREWEKEREEFLVRGAYGTRRVPAAWEGTWSGIALVLLGGFFLVLSFVSNFWGLAPFSIVFALIGVTYAVGTRSIARRYKRALTRYETRRAQLMQGTR